jgi:predicted extracellular nuclease
MITLSIAQEYPGSLQVMFYNVENFFDPFDDSLTEDDEFTPSGERSWTYSRFMDKAVKIARVIIACGDPDPPVIVGLAEVENRFVLEKLVNETPLCRLGYSVIHCDSPDRRGIDVAMIYQKEHVVIDTFYYIPVVLADTNEKTREILMVRGVLYSSDTVVMAFNHWPSRYGGAAGSRHKREIAARSLKEHLEQLLLDENSQNLLIMGDFNDEPSDPSIQLLTGEDTILEGDPGLKLINISAGPDESSGTAKYKGFWYVFDQVVVSETLLKGRRGIVVRNEKAAIFSAAFLLESDNSHLGEKPFRTFYGPAFHDGYSDHLPVFLFIDKL